MVEALASGVEDKLIDGLSFKLQPGASYVLDRRSVTYHPQGSNIYTPGAGTKLIRILLTGEDWLDPSTLRVMFRLNNLALPDPASGGVFPQLRPLGGPWSFFRRMRILAAGQLVEDIDQCNRIHEMMRIFIAKESRENDAAEAFGQYYNLQNGSYNVTNYQGIWPLDSTYVLFKPLSGLSNQNKMMPLRFAPITIELELVDNFQEPIYSTFNPQFGFAATQITQASTSLLWSIDNVQCKVDVCTLDNALHNSYVEHLLQGNSLPLSYNTFVSQLQTIAGQTDVLINVSRALTRLKSVFVTFQKDRAGDINPTMNGRKAWNEFYSPASYDNNDGTLSVKSIGEFEFRLQIGSKIFPEYPIRSHAEAYYQLKKTLGVQASAVHNFDISALEYRDYKFVLGTDCEKVLDAGFTGINTRAGDLMTVHFKYNCSGATSNATTERLANRLHIVLHSDQILEVRSSGCQVFD